MLIHGWGLPTNTTKNELPKILMTPQYAIVRQSKITISCLTDSDNLKIEHHYRNAFIYLPNGVEYTVTLFSKYGVEWALSSSVCALVTSIKLFS